MFEKSKREYYHAVRNLEPSVIDRIEAGTHDDTPYMNARRALYLKMKEYEKTEVRNASGHRHSRTSI